MAYVPGIGEKDPEKIVRSIRNAHERLTNVESSVSSVAARVTVTETDVAAIGSFLSSSVPVGSAVALTTTVVADITSLTLTPGTWDVNGVVVFSPNAATNTTVLIAAVHTTSATLPAFPAENGRTHYGMPFTGGVAQALPCGPRRFTVLVDTPVYLVADAIFTVDTMSAYGFLRAHQATA
jgi:hypothetical protein